MKGAGPSLAVSVLAAELAVIGCGHSSTASRTNISGGQPSSSNVLTTTAATSVATNAPSSQPAPEAIEVAVPTLLPELRIRKRYTCDGAHLSLPVRWSVVPGDIRELGLFVVSAPAIRGKLFPDWAVAGLNSRLGGISSGALPHGAVLDRDSFGHVNYSICLPPLCLGLPSRLTTTLMRRVSAGRVHAAAGGSHLGRGRSDSRASLRGFRLSGPARASRPLSRGARRTPGPCPSGRDQAGAAALNRSRGAPRFSPHASSRCEA
jgi:hypothetical protein